MSSNSYLDQLAGDDLARQERLESLRRGWSRLSGSTLSAIGIVMILIVIVSALLAPIVAPYPGDASGSIHFADQSQSPSQNHIMGTDATGRDIFSRVLYGARISLMMGAVVLILAIGIGVPAGMVAGYIGGRVNTLIMRTADVFLSIPATLLALTVSAALEPTLLNAMIAISVAWWPWYARLVQGEVLSIKEDQFIEASESVGSSRIRIIFKEILPNVLAPITVKATLDIGFVILIGAGLAFLGLGARPPTPSWGSMIAQGRSYVTSYWWMATFPGLAISFTVLGFNLLGDGLRDVFDVEVEER